MKTDFSNVVRYCVQRLVDEPESVNVTTRADRGGTYIDVVVSPNDTGKVIGRSGRIVNALRSLVSAVAAKQRQKVYVKVVPQ